MFIYKTFFPYIGGEKIPLHYYSLLYRELELVWKDLIKFIEENEIEYEAKKHNLSLKINEHELADETLYRIHTSFMIVYGSYKGEEFLPRKIYTEYLLKNYAVEFSSYLSKMINYIENGEYDNAYREAVNALKIVARTENVYAMTGRKIDQLLFEMLHGNIPQTYTNTYILAEKGSKLVRNIAKEIYDSIVSSAKQVVYALKMNIKIIEDMEKRNSIEN